MIVSAGSDIHRIDQTRFLQPRETGSVRESSVQKPRFSLNLSSGLAAASHCAKRSCPMRLFFPRRVSNTRRNACPRLRRYQRFLKRAMRSAEQKHMSWRESSIRGTREVLINWWLARRDRVFPSAYSSQNRTVACRVAAPTDRKPVAFICWWKGRAFPARAASGSAVYGPRHENLGIHKITYSPDSLQHSRKIGAPLRISKNGIRAAGHALCVLLMHMEEFGGVRPLRAPRIPARGNTLHPSCHRFVGCMGRFVHREWQLMNPAFRDAAFA